MGTLQLLDINAALKALSENEKERTHASLFTLVLCTQKHACDLFFRKTIDSIISKFPGRIIAITREPEAKEPYLNVRVEGAPIGASLFCEKIFIDVGGSYEERVPSLVLPHILSDLPAYLIWSGIPPLDYPLLSYAKRVIIESETTSNLKSSLMELAHLIKVLPCELSDLTWSSTEGWRKILVDIFKEDEGRALNELKDLTITYYNAPSNLTAFPGLRALYVQGWLALYQNWQFLSVNKDKGNLVLEYQSTFGKHRVTLHPEAPIEPLPLPMGAITSLELESDYLDAHWVCKRNPSKPQVFVQYSDKKHCHLPTVTALTGAKEGEEIIEELFRPQPQGSYLKVLELLSKMPLPSL